jgi:hypothetical protein
VINILKACYRRSSNSIINNLKSELESWWFVPFGFGVDLIFGSFLLGNGPILLGLSGFAIAFTLGYMLIAIGMLMKATSLLI